MSQGVESEIADSKEHLAFLEALKAVYPDAILGRRWTSPSLKIEDCDGIFLDTEKSSVSDNHFVYCCPYRTIGRGRVYHSERVFLNTLFTAEMKDKSPELYTLIMREMRT